MTVAKSAAMLAAMVAAMVAAAAVAMIAALLAVITAATIATLVVAMVALVAVPRTSSVSCALAASGQQAAADLHTRIGHQHIDARDVSPQRRLGPLLSNFFYHC